ncbi:chromate transporter [Synechococcus sp. MIT S9503]|uniref:chromate transporter n=1 Tax=Synechococcus sp. MIT S9503 TaxID=3082547 RepID=UPI0039A4C72A
MSDQPESSLQSEQADRPGLRELFVCMTQVAFSAFGGGMSLWSHRIIVERRQWMTSESFVTGLTVARLFPGPNQINMSVYIGSIFQGLPGSLAAVAGIILFPFTLLMLLGLLYFQFSAIAEVNRLLAGLAAAAAGMALSMGFKILEVYKTDYLALAIAVIVFVSLQVFRFHLIPVVLVAGPVAMSLYWPRGPGR